MQISPELKDKTSLPVAYSVVLECRHKELEIFHQRFNLFVLAQTILLGFVLNLLASKAPSFPNWRFLEVLFIETMLIFGSVLSTVGYRLMRGATFWVSYYELCLAELEREQVGRGSGLSILNFSTSRTGIFPGTGYGNLKEKLLARKSTVKFVVGIDLAAKSEVASRNKKTRMANRR